MSQKLIKQINSFQTFRYDKVTNRIINMRLKEGTNVDEFLAIQHILDNHRIAYQFDRDFGIELISK